MDISLVRNLSRGAQISGIAAIVLFIDLLLPWYGVGGGLGAAARSFGVSTSVDAWTAFSYTDVLLFILLALAIAWCVTLAMNNPIAEQLKLGVLGLGALMTLIVLYRIVNQPGPNSIVDVKFGAYVGVVLAAVIAFGAFEDSGRTLPTR